MIYCVLEAYRDAQWRIVLRREADGQVVSVWPYPWAMRARGYEELYTEAVVAIMKRRAREDANALGSPTKDGAKMAERHPNLTEYLTADKWDDGDERQTSTLLVFTDDGIFKAVLNDRAEERALWASGASYLDALDALEAMLASGEGEWRAQTGFKSKKRLKRS